MVFTGKALRAREKALSMLTSDLAALEAANHDLADRVAALETDQHALENLLATTEVAAVWLDARLRIRRYTPEATRLLSVIPEDVGRPFQGVMLRYPDPTLLSDLAAAIAQSRSSSREVELENGRRYVRGVLVLQGTDNRAGEAILSYAHVSTEIPQRARRYAQSIVDTVREPMLVLDPQLFIQTANQAFFSTFRLSPQETLGKSLFKIDHGAWDNRELGKLLGEILPEDKVVTDFEIEFRRGLAATRTMLLNARALLNSGHPTSILLAMEDTTERLKSERERKKSRERAQTDHNLRMREAAMANALRISVVEETASNLAHELNQPLSSIVNRLGACTEHVRSGRVDPTNFLDLLSAASSDALCASSILEKVRSSAEKRHLDSRSVDLRELTQRTSQLFRLQLQQKQIHLQLNLPRGPVPIHADRLKIEQVIVSLVQNSIDAITDAHPKRPRVELQLRIDDGEATLSVSDNGPGLPDAPSERLFEPLFSTRPEGLGMGLSISRSIIEAHQGRIWIDDLSPARPGASCHVRIPLSPNAAPDKEVL